MSIGVPYYTITSCCPYFGTQETYFTFLNPTLMPNDTYTYIGAETTINGILFKPGYCYTVTYIGTTLGSYSIINNDDFLFLESDCSNPECLPCTTDCSTYYILSDCCDPDTTFNFCSDETLLGNTYKYTGPDLIFNDKTLESGKCYSLTGASVIGTVNYPPISLIFSQLTSAEGCTDVICPQCTPSYLEFHTCPVGDTPTLFYTNYPNFVPVYPNSIKFTDFIPEEYRDVCLWYGVTECLGGPCTRPPSPLYNVDWTQTDKFTTYESCDDCTFVCYKLVNCLDANDIIYVSNNLETLYLEGQSIKWNDKCWSIEQTEECLNPITITEYELFSGCETCLAKSVVYYELINCNDVSIKIYTSSNLSAYIGKYITLNEYGDDCFYVSAILTLVPSDIPVTPADTFDTCEECSLPRFLLSDCTGIQDDIITNTDLSTYVGKVVVINTCPETCWTVEETNLNVPLVNVTIDQTFLECPECLIALLPLQCVSFTLASGNSASVTAWLSNGTSTQYILNLTNPTIKGCYLTWTITGNVTIKTFGNCIDNQCPEVPKPKRKVTPGYNTPTCSPEYYEKVECAFSEWMYKDVLEKRYGISNCCPEELMKWEIKHEMLMLDSLVNPDYDCNTPVDCGCQQPSTCNCSCNSGN